MAGILASYTANHNFPINLIARILASYMADLVYRINLKAEDLASRNRTEVP